MFYSLEVVPGADTVLARRTVKVVITTVETFAGPIDLVGQIVAEGLDSPVPPRSPRQQRRQQAMRRQIVRNAGIGQTRKLPTDVGIVQPWCQGRAPRQAQLVLHSGIVSPLRCIQARATGAAHQVRRVVETALGARAGWTLREIAGARGQEMVVDDGLRARHC